MSWCLSCEWCCELAARGLAQLAELGLLWIASANATPDGASEQNGRRTETHPRSLLHHQDTEMGKFQWYCAKILGPNPIFRIPRGENASPSLCQGESLNAANKKRPRDSRKAPRKPPACTRPGHNMNMNMIMISSASPKPVEP